PASRPLRFEFSQDLGSQLVEWPVDHCIKCLSFYHPDDAEGLRQEQIGKLRQAYDASRRIGRGLLVEIIASKNGAIADDTIARAVEAVYAAGIMPDWWKLEPQASPTAWRNIERVIAAHDSYCRGIVLLGLEAPVETLRESFRNAADAAMVKGFAVGRTIT